MTKWDDLWAAQQAPPPTPPPSNGYVDPVRGTAYALKALADECAAVAAATEGARDMTLNNAALKMGRHIGAHTIGLDTVRDALLDAGLACGQPRHEVERALRLDTTGGLIVGQQDPRYPAPLPDIPAVTVLDDTLPPEEFTRCWQPVDLSDVLEGTWTPPEPTVGRRTDKVGMFYPGKVHTVASETEAGKTWFALAAVVDELAAGQHVLYLDFEDDEGSIVGRLLALQVARSVILERFHYIRPTDPLGTGIHLDDLAALIADTSPTLAVIDGITEAMTLHGLDPLNNKDVAAFGRIVPRRCAALGIAVVCLDHVTKARESRGRYALGGVHKLNGLDGAAYVLENRSPFGIGVTGKSTVKIAKDRPGQLRRHGLPSSEGLHWFGDLVLQSHTEDFAEVNIEPPHHRDENFRPTVMMTKIADLLGQHERLSGAQIELAISGKNDTIRAARNFLELDGYITRSPHRLLKPYPDRSESQ